MLAPGMHRIPLAKCGAKPWQPNDQIGQAAEKTPVFFSGLPAEA